MKESEGYNIIWQEKLLELPVTGDVDVSWQKMQSLLDNALPVDPLPKTPKFKAPGGGSSLIIIAGTVVTAALLYIAAPYVFKKESKPANKTEKHQPVKIDSLADTAANVIDTSGNVSDTTNYSKYSLSQTDTADLKSINNEAATNINPDKSIKYADAAASLTEKIKENKNERQTGITNNGNAQIATSENTGGARLQKNGGTGERKALAAVNNGKTGLGKADDNTAIKRSNQGAAASQPDTVNSITSAQKNKDEAALKSGMVNLATLQQQTSAAGSSKQNEVKEENVVQSGVVDSTTAPQDRNKDISQPDAAELAGTGIQPNGIIPHKKVPKSKSVKFRQPKIKPYKAPKPGSLYNEEGDTGLELGLKVLANTNGSFTDKAQNKNFYGRAPADVFFGMDITYHFNKNLALGTGIQILSPRIISGSYSSNAYTTANDTGLVIQHGAGVAKVNVSRKFYGADIPLKVSYKLSKAVSINAGAMISIPAKQDSLRTSLTVGTLIDSARSMAVINNGVNNTSLTNKTNVNITAGVKVNLNRFYLEASYIRALKPYAITSPVGSGTSKNYQTFQFGIGYRLAVPKKKR